MVSAEIGRKLRQVFLFDAFSRPTRKTVTLGGNLKPAENLQGLLPTLGTEPFRLLRAFFFFFESGILDQIGFYGGWSLFACFRL